MPMVQKLLGGIFFLLSLSLFAQEKSKPIAEPEKDDVELRVGVYLMTTDPVYIYAKRRIYPIPYVSGSYSQFYAEGTEAGYLFNPESSLRLKVFIKVDTQSLEPEDSPELKGIRSRGFLGFAGLKAGFDLSPLKVSLGLGQEIFFRAKGQRAKLKISTVPITFMDSKLEFIPFFWFVWDSQKINQYYYGVTQNEAASSGFQSYQAQDSFTPHLGFWLLLSQIEPWSLGTSYSLAFLDETVKNSPIVDKKTLGSFILYFSYTF